MADPVTLLVMGAVTVGSGGIAMVLRVRQQRLLRGIFAIALDDDNAAPADVLKNFPGRGVGQATVAACDKPATLHLIVRRSEVLALLEIFDPELLESGAFSKKQTDPSLKQFKMTLVDPEKEPTVARRMGAVDIQRVGGSGLIGWRLPALSDPQTGPQARDALKTALALHERLRAETGLQDLQACPRCDDSQLGDNGRGPKGTLGCEVCAGLFLTQAGAQSFFDELGLSPGEVNDRQAAQTLTCPGCAHAMTALLQNDVVVDVCSHCGGVWLDGDEASTFLTTMSSS